jgi:hypothetical protein
MDLIRRSDLGQFLSVPENREAVRSIVVRALRAIEPGEAEVALRYMEPLIDLVGRDEVMTADLWEEPGRSGRAELLLPLLVPLISMALARAAAGGPVSVTREELKAMIVRTHSSTDRRQRDDIERALNAALVAKRDRLSLLRQARGMWKERDDLPDLMRQLRKEVDTRKH